MVETSGAAQARDCANLIRFLTFTGCRVSEAKAARWSDVDWHESTLTIHSVKVRGNFDGSAVRVLPLNPFLKQLLEQMQHDQNPELTDPICRVHECQKSLNRACKLVGCARITHHDLRRFFVSKAIENGVDVLTLAQWVGHRDNGKLLLKVYAQLSAAHSHEPAARMTFGAAPLPARPDNVVPMKQIAQTTGP